MRKGPTLQYFETAVPEEPVQLKMKLRRSSDLATEPVRQATTERACFKKLLSRPSELLQNISLNARKFNLVPISKGSPSILNTTLAQGEASSLRPQLHDLHWPSTSGGSPAARRCPVSRLASYLPTSRYPGWPHLQHLCLLRPGEPLPACFPMTPKLPPPQDYGAHLRLGPLSFSLNCDLFLRMSYHHPQLLIWVWAWQKRGMGQLIGIQIYQDSINNLSYGS